MWDVERIINFENSGQLQDGFTHFGLHDARGTQYVLAYSNNWIGALSGNDQLIWSAGERPPFKTSWHFDITLLTPTFISECRDGSLIVSAKNGVFKINVGLKHAKMIINAKDEGLDFIGNAVVDNDDCIWINDVRACRIHKYSSVGDLIEVLGSGKPGFTPETVYFEKVSFNWMYDLRMGVDGNLYVLDSKNFAVRMIDVTNRTVSLIGGTGEPGYSGDGGGPLQATFGGNNKEQFDGPWAISLDEENNIYVGDTQNHVLRMIDRKKNIITTIAGNHDVPPKLPNNPAENNPLSVSLPKICSLDYYNGRLFIPEISGDLVVLKRKDGCL
jgi:hypothetical protein